MSTPITEQQAVEWLYSQLDTLPANSHLMLSVSNYGGIRHHGFVANGFTIAPNHRVEGHTMDALRQSLADASPEKFKARQIAELKARLAELEGSAS